MARATEARKGAVFVGLVLSLALGAALLIRLLEIDSEFTGALLYMTTPTVATMLMLLVVTRDGWSRDAWRSLGLHRSRRRTWPLAGARGPLGQAGRVRRARSVQPGARWRAPAEHPAGRIPVTDRGLRSGRPPLSSTRR